MATSIEIDYACSGTKVPRSFTATGNWTLDTAAVPTISCKLKLPGTPGGTPPPDMDPLSPPIVSPTTASLNGTWSARFQLGADQPDTTLVANLISGSASADDAQSGIDVEDTPAMAVPMPMPIPTWPPAATVTYSVPLDVTNPGKFIICTAFVSHNKELTTLLDQAVAVETATGWKVDFKFNQNKLPVGDKIAVLALVINKHGKIIGRSLTRSPKRP